MDNFATFALGREQRSGEAIALPAFGIDEAVAQEGERFESRSIVM